MCEPGDAFFKRSPGMAHKFEGAAEATSMKSRYLCLGLVMTRRRDPSFLIGRGRFLKVQMPRFPIIE